MNKLMEQLAEAKRLGDDGLVAVIADQIAYMLAPVNYDPGYSRPTNIRPSGFPTNKLAKKKKKLKALGLPMPEPVDFKITEFGSRRKNLLNLFGKKA